MPDDDLLNDGLLDGGAGGGGGTPQPFSLDDAALDKIATMVAEKIGGGAPPDGGGGGTPPPASGGGGDNSTSVIEGNPFMQQLAGEIRAGVMEEFKPMMVRQTLNDLATRVPNLPKEAFGRIEAALSNIPAPALAQMARTGADALLAKAAAFDELMGGKVDMKPYGFEPVRGDDASGSEGQRLSLTEQARSEIAQFEAMTGRKVTPAELKEWGYV